ncbi:MAG: hypothetical protein M1527_00435 [Gammaproteobacteria bacterium]|nr:hypothetical protein [Gammaproteobacteria bacterium]
MKNLVVVVASVLALTACAPQQALLKSTVSGYPEGSFSNSTVEVVRSKLIDGCSSRGILVQEAAGNQVVCGKTMDGGDAVLAQMLVGNSYSTTPERKIRFVIYQSGSDVKVSAQQWIESQMAFGQVRRQELNSNNQKNDIQQFLFSLGAQ